MVFGPAPGLRAGEPMHRPGQLSAGGCYATGPGQRRRRGVGRRGAAAARRGGLLADVRLVGLDEGASGVRRPPASAGAPGRLVARLRPALERHAVPAHARAPL